MMGDTPSGVVARRIQPSGVASFGRVTHAPADPRVLCEAIRRSLLHQSRAAPGSPKVGSRMVRGGGGGGLRRAVLGQGCRRVRGCPHGSSSRSSPRTRFVEQIIDKDGLTVLKTVEVPQLQFIIVGLGMHLIETVQKTVEVPQLPSRLVVQFMDKVVDMPVVQCVDKVVDVSVVCRYAHCLKPVKLPQVQSLDKVLQFIDKVAHISVVAQG